MQCPQIYMNILFRSQREGSRFAVTRSKTGEVSVG